MWVVLGQKHNKQREKNPPDEAGNKNTLSSHLDYGMQKQDKKEPQLKILRNKLRP